jgi:hypothetical protein
MQLADEQNRILTVYHDFLWPLDSGQYGTDHGFLSGKEKLDHRLINAARPQA